MCLQTLIWPLLRAIDPASNWTDDESQSTILALPVSHISFLYYAHLWKYKTSIDLKILQMRAAQNMHVQVIKDVTIILLFCSISSITCFIRTMVTVFWKEELTYFRKMNNLKKKKKGKKEREHFTSDHPISLRFYQKRISLENSAGSQWITLP